MFGNLGVIKYLGNKVQCHVCGKFFKAVCSSHAIRIHGLSAYQYKKEFGLCNTYGIVSKETSRKYAIALRPNLTYPPNRAGGCYNKEPKRLQTKLIMKRIFDPHRWDKHKLSLRKSALKRYYLTLELRKSGLSHKEIARLYGYKNAKTSINSFYKRKKLL